MDHGSPFATPGNLAKLAVFSFAQLRTLRSCIIQLLPYIVGACTIVVAGWGLASCMTPTWTLVWTVLVVEAARHGHVFFCWLADKTRPHLDRLPAHKEPKSHRRRSRSSANHCFRHRCHLSLLQPLQPLPSRLHGQFAWDLDLTDDSSSIAAVELRLFCPS